MCFGQQGPPPEPDDGAPDLGNLPPDISSTAPTLGGAGVGGPGPAAPGPTPLGIAGTAASFLPSFGKPGTPLGRTTGAAKGAVTGAAAGAPMGPPGMAVGALLGALPALFGKKPKVPMQPVQDPSADLMRSFGGV